MSSVCMGRVLAWIFVAVTFCCACDSPVVEYGRTITASYARENQIEVGRAIGWAECRLAAEETVLQQKREQVAALQAQKDLLDRLLAEDVPAWGAR